MTRALALVVLLLAAAAPLCASGAAWAGSPASYAVIDGTNTVVNVVMWDGTACSAGPPPSGWCPPAGTTTQPLGSSNAGIGWTWNPSGGTFTPPSGG